MDIKGTMQRALAGTGILMVTLFAGKVMVDENARREKAFKKAEAAVQRAALECDQGKNVIIAAQRASKATDRLDKRPVLPMGEVSATQKYDLLPTASRQASSNSGLPEARNLENAKPASSSFRQMNSSNVPKNGQKNPARVDCLTSAGTPSGDDRAQPSRSTDQAGSPDNPATMPTLQRNNGNGNICLPSSFVAPQQPQNQGAQDKADSNINPDTVPDTEDHSEAEPEQQPDISDAAKKLWVTNQSPVKEDETSLEAVRSGGRCGK